VAAWCSVQTDAIVAAALWAGAHNDAAGRASCSSWPTGVHDLCPDRASRK